MREIKQDELKKIQIGILSQVHNFCEEHEIQYWLDCGTLLGAVRHGGYIPWDDDIDIGMLRDDYDKFMNEFNLENNRYRFECYEKNKDFLYMSGKVLDTNTILYEPDKNGNKIAVNIDVFVYDNAPDCDKKLQRMYDKRDVLRRMHQQRNSKHRIEGSLVRRLMGSTVRFFTKLFPRDYFIRAIIKNSQKYCKKETGRVGNFVSYARIACDKKIVSETVEIGFEEYKFKAPKGYVDWLTAFYGDYMVLPPKEKQVGHHMFEAYYKNGKGEA